LDGLSAALSGSRTSLLVRDLATQTPAPAANTNTTTMSTCTRAGSARAHDCGRLRSLDTCFQPRGDAVIAYIRAAFFLPQTCDAWVNGAGPRNGFFAGAILRKRTAANAKKAFRPHG
jgi:hypothetical protein